MTNIGKFLSPQWSVALMAKSEGNHTRGQCTNYELYRQWRNSRQAGRQTDRRTVTKLSHDRMVKSSSLGSGGRSTSLYVTRIQFSPTCSETIWILTTDWLVEEGFDNRRYESNCWSLQILLSYMDYISNIKSKSGQWTCITILHWV